jgi:DNA-binding NarL/FixJ family response regulator
VSEDTSREVRGICWNRDPDLWFSKDPGEQAKAKTICLEQCARLAICRGEALANPHTHGILAGMTPKECGDIKSGKRPLVLVPPPTTPPAPKRPVLTPRNLEVQRLSRQGLTVEKIAARLGLHPSTVSRDRDKIRRVKAWDDQYGGQEATAA